MCLILYLKYVVVHANMWRAKKQTTKKKDWEENFTVSEDWAIFIIYILNMQLCFVCLNMSKECVS